MKQVDFLALEGGGGKGTAYLSLVKVLEEKGYIETIKGYSGASAGAITAFLLSIGVTYEQMLNYIFEDKSFQKFIPIEESYNFKRPSYRCVIQREDGVSGGRMFLPNLMEKEKYQLHNDISSYFSLPQKIDTVISLFIPGNFITKSFIKYLGPVSNYIQRKKDELLKEFSNYITPSTVTNLTGLGGLFSGESVIETLNNFLFEALWKKNEKSILVFGEEKNKYKYYEQENRFELVERTNDTKSLYASSQRKIPYLNAYNKYDKYSSQFIKLYLEGEIEFYTSGYWNFERLYNVFEKDLYITASNLVDGETYIFSKETTPDFPVVYAVAISMNLPVWTPIFVSYVNKLGIDYTGWYFDGGLYNNFPVRLFSNDISSKLKCKPQNELMSFPLRDNTFGFYVGEKSAYLKQFPAFKSVGSSLSDSLMDKSTFGKFYKDEINKVLALKTEGLSTYNFTPEKSIFDSLKKENEKRILDFLSSD